MALFCGSHHHGFDGGVEARNVSSARQNSNSHRRLLSGDVDVVAQIDILDRVEDSDPFLHGLLERLAAADQATATRGSR
jgi:hypothetical protein